jgi:hypothetical protein
MAGERGSIAGTSSGSTIGFRRGGDSELREGEAITNEPFNNRRVDEESRSSFDPTPLASLWI